MFSTGFFFVFSLLLSEASSFTPALVAVSNSPATNAFCTFSSLPMSSTSTATEASNPRKEGLALQLDDGTRKSHSVAENTAFVTGFFKGLSTKESYSNLMTSLYFVYAAMEEAFDATTEKSVKEMDDAELRRMDAVSADMEYFYGENWKNKITPSKATRKYVDRIKEVARDQPKLLVAHQYSEFYKICIFCFMI